MASLTLAPCMDADLDILALLNKQLIEDEKHDNKMDMEQLKERMRLFINTDYKAYLFKNNEAVIGYALANTAKEPLYLRQLGNIRYIDDMAVIKAFDDGKEATRELVRAKDDVLVYHTGKEKVEVEIEQIFGYKGAI